MKPFKEQMGWDAFKRAVDDPERHDCFVLASLVAILLAVWPLTIIAGIGNYRRTGSPWKSGIK